jgi:hypothetical protein
MHLASPAAEARLDDDREVEVGQLGVAGNALRARVREPGSTQGSCSDQLVVGPEKRRRRVQDPDSGLGQPLQRREPILDTLEVVTHVEARERRVAALEHE